MLYVPDKSAIVRYWQDHEQELVDILGYIPDWGEPACWVCGWAWDGKYTKWNDIPLERCHIIPRARGGPNTPDNLVLMCITCHDLAPDVICLRGFAQWAKSQSWLRRTVREFLLSIEDMQLPLDDASLDRYTDALSSPVFIEFMRTHGSAHWFRNSRSGYQVKTASIASLLYLYLIKNQC